MKQINITKGFVFLILISTLLVLNSCERKGSSPDLIYLALDDVFTTTNKYQIFGDIAYPIHSVGDVKIIQDHIYLLSIWQNQLTKYYSNGHFMDRIGGSGTGPCEFNGPRELFYTDDKLSVLEAGNNRLQTIDLNLKCEDITLLPFLPAAATYHSTTGEYSILGNMYSGSNLRFVHKYRNGEVVRSYSDVPDDLLYSYYSTDIEGNLMWGNVHSRFFEVIDFENGKQSKYEILDTTFVSIFDELTDFEVLDQSDLRELMSKTRELTYSQIFESVYKKSYLFIGYSNINSTRANQVVIQSLNNPQKVVLVNLGDYRFSSSVVDDELIFFHHDDSEYGKLNLFNAKINFVELDRMLQ